MLLAALSLTGMLLAAEPLELIKREGELVLTDSSSFFVFKADGTFQSFPNGMSGRTFAGTWKSPPGEPQIFEVLAVQSWLNGGSVPDDQRKLVFAIYAGKTKPLAPAKPVKRVYEGSWLLQELSKVAKK